MNEIKPHQSIELLKELHILTRDGVMNQDSRRKLKQVNHLCQFIEPLISKCGTDCTLVDLGAGKSYLGFILYDLFLKTQHCNSKVVGIETRSELVEKSKKLAQRLKFDRMNFISLTVLDSITSEQLPERVDIVTALHACDTATDDAINFGLKKNAKYFVLVPCCQAEIASILKKNKAHFLAENALCEVWRHPLHTREFGSHLTNVLRCLMLEAHGYKVTVTELVGWEHSMKNELIIAEKMFPQSKKSIDRLDQLINTFGLEELNHRFYGPN